MKKRKIFPSAVFVEEPAMTVMVVAPKPRMNFDLTSSEAPGSRLAMVPMVSLPMKAPPSKLMV